MQIFETNNLYHFIVNFPTFLLILALLLGITILYLSYKLKYSVEEDNFNRTNIYGTKIYKDFNDCNKVKARNNLKVKASKLLSILAAIMIVLPLLMGFLKYMR